MPLATPTAAPLPHDLPEATPPNASFAAGDLLDAPADAICNPVNLAGVMGRGLALQFRTRWPASCHAYRAALRSGALGRGRVHAHHLPDGRHVLHCPTKDHWRERSPIALVRATIDAIGPCCVRQASARSPYRRSAAASAASTGRTCARCCSPPPPGTPSCAGSSTGRRG